jgi:hypothetical protein
LLSANNRHWQLQARDVFATYTHRFPAGRLHDVYILDQVHGYVTVCAAEGSQVGRGFCTEINFGQRTGRQVEGGFHYKNFDMTNPFDCFGDTTLCYGLDGS